MMNDLQKKMAEKMGLTESNFKGNRLEGAVPSLSTEELALAVAELAEVQAADKLEIEMAIAELAEVILNG